MPSAAIAIPSRPAGAASGRTFSQLVSHLAAGVSVRDSATYLEYHDAYASFVGLGQDPRHGKSNTPSHKTRTKTPQNLHFANFAIGQARPSRFPVYPHPCSYTLMLHPSSHASSRAVGIPQPRGEELDEALMFEGHATAGGGASCDGEEGACREWPTLMLPYFAVYMLWPYLTGSFAAPSIQCLCLCFGMIV
jgi:hypothetical protein